MRVIALTRSASARASEALVHVRQLVSPSVVVCRSARLCPSPRLRMPHGIRLV
jgi:hypothetical protein